MSKTVLFGIAVVVFIGGMFALEHFNQPIVYEREHIEQPQEEVIEKPEYPAEWLEEAEAAREAVIKRRKLEAERDELIESRTEIQERINEIEKELNVY